MPLDPRNVISRLLAGDVAATQEILSAAHTSQDPTVLVAAALVARDAHDLIDRAGACAQTPPDRQLVVIAAAYLRGDLELVDALAREHLVDHPGSVLVAWIASADRQPPPTEPGHPSRPSPKEMS